MTNDGGKYYAAPPSSSPKGPPKTTMDIIPFPPLPIPFTVVHWNSINVIFLEGIGVPNAVQPVAEPRGREDVRVRPHGQETPRDQ